MYINIYYFIFEVKIPVSFIPVNPVTSRCLLLNYEVESDPICAFLEDTTVQIAKDKFFKFLFKHKIPKKQGLQQLLSSSTCRSQYSNIKTTRSAF